MKREYNKSGPTRRTFLKKTGGGVAALAMSSVFSPALAQNKELSIIINQNNTEAVAAFEQIIAKFERATGSVVTLNKMDHEAHKISIRNYLVAGAPDVCFWFSGNRMKNFVQRGLFDDISDLFQDQKYADVLGGTASAVTVDGKQFGLPLGGTLWGNFYLTDVFDKHNLTAPTNWSEMLDFGEKAKSAGITPQAIGTKELWPCAGFFDELNLRINGLESHIALMDGKMSYLDPSLKPVFDHWEDLIKADFFLKNHSSYGWQEAGAILGQGKAGLMNLGNFVKYAIPKDRLQNLAFAPFPKISDIGRYEDFSVDSIHIPSAAKNKDVAREFLAFLYLPENLSAYLTPTGNIPPRNDMPESTDPLINMAMKSLETVEGTAQYYDRDTDPDMAQAGLKGFQEFMVKPERRDQILERLEKTRQRIFKI